MNQLSVIQKRKRRKSQPSVQHPFTVPGKGVHHHQPGDHHAPDDVPDLCRTLRIGHIRQPDQQHPGGEEQVHHALDDDGRQNLTEGHARFSAKQKDAPHLAEPEGQDRVQQISLTRREQHIGVFGFISQ